MSKESNPHLKWNLIPHHAKPGEICDAEFGFWHSESGGATFTLKVRVVNPNYDSEVYSQTTHYTPHEIHHRIANFKAPDVPGAYEVIVSALSASGEELESAKSMLLVGP
jgi:hypothetical protein